MFEVFNLMQGRREPARRLSLSQIQMEKILAHTRNQMKTENESTNSLFYSDTSTYGEFILAKELFVIPDEGNYILYAPVKKNILLVNKAAVKRLQDFSQGQKDCIDPDSMFFKQLVQAEILVSANKSNPTISFPKNQTEFDPEGVSLFLTTRCNMHCVYCYSNGGDSHKVMPWETAKAAIDWIINHTTLKGRNKLNVSFHGGGEVTTSAELMKRCVKYARQQASHHRITVRFDAGLNGVMDSRTLGWIIENLDGATVSLDGLKEIQNLQRPLANGKASYDLVCHTLRRLDERRFRYGIRATVTRESLEKLVDSVGFIAKNFQATVIQLEPVFIAGRAIRNSLAPVDPQLFVEHYRKALAEARQYGVELKYSGARFNIITNTFCKVPTGNAFAVTQDGRVASCYEITSIDDTRAALFFYGKFDRQSGKFELDCEKIRKLRSLTVENKPYCQTCFCKWHCAGDCPAKMALLGDAWDTSTNPRCIINRELTKDQMKEYLL
jgi:uncharacterized protein